MAVKISGLKPIITCPATLFLPGDNGEHIKHQFTVDFKRISTQERDDLHLAYTIGRKVTQPDVAGTAQPVVKTVTVSLPELLDQIVVGWGGMLDENGNPVPYSHEERRAADVEFTGLEQAMAVSWYDHFFIHQREAATKNSKAQSGTTSA